MRFAKMHGLGNDFVVVDAIGDPDLAEAAERLAPALCDRRLGIGADGVLIATLSGCADFEMIMVNPDGTRGMCGNGLRCFVRFLRATGRTGADEVSVDTPNGVTRARLVPSEDAWNGDVEVDMGPPRLLREQVPMCGPAGEQVIDEPLQVGNETFTVTCVSMGNPHCVVFVDDPGGVDLERLGPAIENHPAFPERTNVHFVRVESERELRLRVWERGAGMTAACGTGACAAVVAGVLSGRCGREAVVRMPGGDLDIRWLPSGHVMMRGPARTPFTGEIDLEHLPGA